MRQVNVLYNYQERAKTFHSIRYFESVLLLQTLFIFKCNVSFHKEHFNFNFEEIFTKNIRPSTTEHHKLDVYIYFICPHHFSPTQHIKINY